LISLEMSAPCRAGGFVLRDEGNGRY
jgi:hypothetical protein